MALLACCPWLAPAQEARQTIIELDNARPVVAEWRVDGQPQEAVTAFGIGRIQIIPGTHELRVTGADGFTMQFQIETLAGETMLVPLASERSYQIEWVGARVSKELREEVTGRYFYSYDWYEVVKREKIDSTRTFSRILDSGLSGPDCSKSPRQPKNTKDIFAKLYRLAPKKPSQEECLAAVDLAATAYHGNERLRLLEILAREPLSPAVATAAVSALCNYRFLPDSLVDRLVKEGKPELLDGLSEEKIKKSFPLLQLYIRFIVTEKVQALYRNARSDSEKKDILRATVGAAWDKARPLGEEALASPQESFRSLGVKCLLRPELFQDAVLRDKVKLSLGEGPNSASQQRQYATLLSQAQVTEATPAALEEIRKTLQNADPKIAGNAAIQCVISDNVQATSLLAEELPRINEKARRILLLHWQENPLPPTSNRVDVLTHLLASPEEFIYVLTAKLLLKPDYLANPEAWKALEAFTRNPPAKAGWQYESICRKVAAAKPGTR